MTASVGLGAVAVIQTVASPSLSETVRAVELNPTITGGGDMREREKIEVMWRFRYFETHN